MSLVQIDHLCRSFGGVHAVRDLSLNFDAGQIMGFIGPNGAGKSTSMRILATLDLPSSGDCRVAGLSTVDDADAVRRLIGFMPDGGEPYPHMTVWEYLDFFARAYDLGPVKGRQAVEGVMDFCQLDGISGKLASTLSKGMRQRLSLGRCLIHDPQVLILDEPSAGLDPRARIEFRDLLKALTGRGKAVLISSHILSELDELCDRVAIIEQGRLVAHGTVEDVKTQARQARDVAPGPDRQRLVDLRLAEDRDDWERTLAEQPGLRIERCDRRSATIRLEGGDADQARLAKALMDRGLPLCHCAARADGLEDVFMHLTDGAVQ